MDTLTVALADIWLVLYISSRNTMSVMEDIENAGSTLVLRLMAIVKCLCQW